MVPVVICTPLPRHRRPWKNPAHQRKMAKNTAKMRENLPKKARKVVPNAVNHAWKNPAFNGQSMVENFEFQAPAGSVMHKKRKFTITTMRLKARLVWLVRPGHGRRLGMNSSIQDVAVRDRLVHSELSGVVVCSTLVAVYHCFITHQITTRSRARVKPHLCATL